MYNFQEGSITGTQSTPMCLKLGESSPHSPNLSANAFRHVLNDNSVLGNNNCLRLINNLTRLGHASGDLTKQIYLENQMITQNLFIWKIALESRYEGLFCILLICQTRSIRNQCNQSAKCGKDTSQWRHSQRMYMLHKHLHAN